jgi:preprotein translocase subunit Sec63
MTTYEYDEAGVMAAYFLITFLALVLVPLTISVLTTRPGGWSFTISSLLNGNDIKNS